MWAKGRRGRALRMDQLVSRNWERKSRSTHLVVLVCQESWWSLRTTLLGVHWCGISRGETREGSNNGSACFQALGAPNAFYTSSGMAVPRIVVVAPYYVAGSTLVVVQAEKRRGRSPRMDQLVCKHWGRKSRSAHVVALVCQESWWFRRTMLLGAHEGRWGRAPWISLFPRIAGANHVLHI